MAKSFVGFGSIPSREYNTSGRLAIQVLDTSIGSSVNTQLHRCTEDLQEWTTASVSDPVSVEMKEHRGDHEAEEARSSRGGRPQGKEGS